MAIFNDRRGPLQLFVDAIYQEKDKKKPVWGLLKLMMWALFTHFEWHKPAFQTIATVQCTLVEGDSTGYPYVKSDTVFHNF